MRKPQTEKGFLRLATGDEENDILLALIHSGLTGMQWDVVMLIIRKTYGYNKKEDWISLSQFVQHTGRTRQGILKAIASLEDMRMITTNRGDRQKTMYGFNKLFHEWRLGNHGLLVNSSLLVNSRCKTRQPRLRSQATAAATQKTITKENTKETPTVMKLSIFSPSNLMPDFIVEASPDGDQQEKKPKKKQPFNWNDYAELTRLMKKTCGFTTLINGTKPQDNYARHILLLLLKIMTKEHEWPEQEAIDQIRANMEEFCQLVQDARNADKFLHSRLTSLQEIYFELKRGRIFEAVKKRSMHNTGKDIIFADRP